MAEGILLTSGVRSAANQSCRPGRLAENWLRVGWIMLEISIPKSLIDVMVTTLGLSGVRYLDDRILLLRSITAMLEVLY